MLISIHAPARGATKHFRYFISGIHDFNPRSREGSDKNAESEQWVSLDFNPRSREGSDTTAAAVMGEFQNFNPRSREGSDADALQISNSAWISIHAPARGAT